MKNLFTTVYRGLALATLLTAGSLGAQAQNVGIGTTAPDVSAALDIVSSSKGVLLPRVAATAGVPTPATGLVVYQTGGTPGYYYNSGTPGAPVWQQFATAAGAAVTASNGLTKTGSNIALGGTLTGATTIAQAGNSFNLTGAGNVGIGTATPQQRLDVNGGTRVEGFGAFTGGAVADQGAHLQWNRSGLEGETWLINHLGLGAANAGIRFAGITTATGTTPTEWARFLNNGFFGIGTTAPRTLLDLGSSFGVNPSDPLAKKFAVFNDSGFNFYGLGVSDSQLNFYVSTGAASAPGLVLRNNGNVGIGVGNAAPTARLQVVGAGGFNVDVATNGRIRTGDGTNTGGVWLDAATTQFVGQFDATTVGIYNNLDWRLLVANNGNVGIGTTAPVFKLDVAGDISSTNQVRASGVVLSGNGSILGNFGIGTASPTTRLQVAGSGGFGIDLAVNGRLRTGDAANNGGVWLDAATTQFVGQFDANTLGLWNNGSFRLLVANNGNVGIGTSAPAYKLEVAGDINAIGQVRANGVAITSDTRFKQQVRPLGGALAAVQALRGVRYTWNALGIRHGGQAGAEQVGVLAQELEKVFPELVSTGPDGYKAVNYAQLTPVLIEAIKEQQQQIEALKAQNTADHASLQTLQAQMARLLGETAPAGARASK